MGKSRGVNWLHILKRLKYTPRRWSRNRKMDGEETVFREENDWINDLRDLEIPICDNGIGFLRWRRDNILLQKWRSGNLVDKVLEESSILEPEVNKENNKIEKEWKSVTRSQVFNKWEFTQEYTGNSKRSSWYSQITWTSKTRTFSRRQAEKTSGISKTLQGEYPEYYWTWDVLGWERNIILPLRGLSGIKQGTMFHLRQEEKRVFENKLNM